MKKNIKKLPITILLILSPMSSLAQMPETNEKKLTLETLLDVGSTAPSRGVLVPETNYRLYNKCIDEADMEEMNYNAAKSKDAWNNTGKGFLIGIIAGLMIKH